MYFIIAMTEANNNILMETVGFFLTALTYAPFESIYQPAKTPHKTFDYVF